MFPPELFRFALLLSEDLPGMLELFDEEELRQDLKAYSVSQEYLRLRQELGIAIPVTGPADDGEGPRS